MSQNNSTDNLYKNKVTVLMYLSGLAKKMIQSRIVYPVRGNDVCEFSGRIVYRFLNDCITDFSGRILYRIDGPISRTMLLAVIMLI